MAKYRAEFKKSFEVIEQEAMTIKHIYDLVKSELRWSLTHEINYRDIAPFEEVCLYRWDDVLNRWNYIGSMFAHRFGCDDWIIEAVNLYYAGRRAQIYRKES